MSFPTSITKPRLSFAKQSTAHKTSSGSKLRAGLTPNFGDNQMAESYPFSVYKVRGSRGYFYGREDAKSGIGPWTHVWRSADSRGTLIERHRLIRVAKTKTKKPNE